ncbi:MAG: Hpt domain-containing protein [Eggerthellaceae bacterium]|nr:Hpt domain-containing protein [Eggerthellaceae bacterium]
MTLEELYAQIGGSYQEALDRMRSERLVSKFVVKFLADDSCSRLMDAWDAGDEAAAFKAAHEAKGVCSNLCMTKLAALTAEITETLRPGNDELRTNTDVDALVNDLRRLYGHVTARISEFAGQQ